MLNLLFITLEFVEPIFSGNGVYSRSLVRILAALPDVHILVVSGRSEASENSANDWGNTHERVEVLSVPLPVWRKLDKASSWREFGPLCAATHSSKIADFKPDVVVGVDWTSLGVYQTLSEKEVLKNQQRNLPTVPLLYFNFRVFFESAGISESDRLFYQERWVLD